MLALDQGTTGSTCLVIRSDGVVVGRGYREITQHFPRPGWVEHDAEEIFWSTCAAARDAITASGVLPEAIGITNQRETVVLWDRSTGKPIGRAIVWQDRRTAARCAELKHHEEMIGRKTGLVIDPYFSATKIEWMLRADPDLRLRAVAGEILAGTIDTWLIWKLTGGLVHATDPTNASRTMLFDIDARSWDSELCALFGVPMNVLPEVHNSLGSFGVAESQHLGTELPILGVAGDQQSALFGQGCWNEGDGKNTYGTGAFLLFNAGQTRPPTGGGLLTTLGCGRNGEPVYALEAAIFIAGAAIQWLRDGLGIIESAAQTEGMAASLEANDGVYFVPSLTGMGAPYWESAARGMITGLTRGTSRAHFVRAGLEAMAYGTADVVNAVRTHGRVRVDLLRVDGGATSNDWLMQFQADLLGVPVERPSMAETTALGAAGLAGIGAGIWQNAAEFLGAQKFVRFEPGKDRSKVKNAYLGWQRAVRAALSWARDAEPGEGVEAAGDGQ